MIRSHNRGWPTVYKKDEWVYEDDGTLASEERSCKKCRRSPTKEGYDACLGYIRGAISVCCGHGVYKEITLFNEEKSAIDERLRKKRTVKRFFGSREDRERAFLWLRRVKSKMIQEEFLQAERKEKKALTDYVLMKRRTEKKGGAE